jgi:hypothetical protein
MHQEEINVIREIADQNEKALRTEVRWLLARLRNFIRRITN